MWNFLGNWLGGALSQLHINELRRKVGSLFHFLGLLVTQSPLYGLDVLQSFQQEPKPSLVFLHNFYSVLIKSSLSRHQPLSRCIIPDHFPVFSLERGHHALPALARGVSCG